MRNTLQKYRRVILVMTLLFLFIASPAYGDATGSVIGGTLHLRDAAATSANIVASYDSGTKVTVVARQGDFYRVETEDGKTGYMMAKYISLVRPGVVENGEKFVNLRKGTSSSSLILGQYKTGDTLDILQDAGDWKKVEIDGQQGYIMSKFIKELPGAEAEIPEDTPAVTATAPPAATPIQPQTTPAAQSGPVTTVGDGSMISNDENFTYTMYYPMFQHTEADWLVSQWMEQCIEEATMLRDGAAPGEESIDMSAQYVTYRTDNRYLSVIEHCSIYSGSAQNPQELVFTLNMDTVTGALLNTWDILDPARTDDALTLLAKEVFAMEGGAFAEITIDDSWLHHTVITQDGLLVVLPKGEFLPAAAGEVRLLLPHEQLAEKALLSIALTGPLPVSEETQAPGVPVYTVEFRAIDPTRPMIALTFDDGPSQYTNRILEILTENDAVATFFVVGERADLYPEVLQNIVAQGSEIGNHSWSHRNLEKISKNSAIAQLKDTNDAVKRITGVDIKVMRPPYGAHNKTVRNICKDMDMTIATWTLDTKDWATKSSRSTYRTIMKEVENGCIILCHDIHEPTLTAMETVIPELVEKGYQLVTVSELLSFTATGGEAGKVYYKLNIDTMRIPE